MLNELIEAFYSKNNELNNRKKTKIEQESIKQKKNTIARTELLSDHIQTIIL